MEIPSDDTELDIQQSSSRLRNLQSQHKQLQECLNQRKHSLLLHCKMLSQIDNNSLTKQNQALILELFKKQQQIQLAYANMLINSQIRIEEELQYRDLLKQYQNRIFQLRMMMVDKQVQLVSQMQTKKRQFAPTKEHLKQLFMAQVEQGNIKKLLKQYSTLSNQVKKLEEDYRAKSQQTRDATDYTQEEQPHHQGFKKSSKENPQSGIFKDRLLHRVYTLLQQEIQIENKLKEQCETLLKQNLELTHQHQTLIHQYQSLYNTGNKVLEGLNLENDQIQSMKLREGRGLTEKDQNKSKNPQIGDNMKKNKEY